jgi:hypothetical protein
LGGYDPNFWGLSGDSDSGNTQAASANADAGNQGGQEQGPDYGQYPGGYGPPDAYPPAPRSPYQPSANEPRPSATLETEAAVTLVFKDGRPPEQVHNYVLTRTTLYVQDQNRRNIPVDELDIAATAKTNLDAGVVFQVPTLPN